MNRRTFLKLFPILSILPIEINANPLGWIFRGILRSSFRSLARGGGRYAMRTVGNSVVRTGGRISRPNRITRTFGRQRHTIKDRDGKVLGNAKVEGDVLMIRDTQNRIMGYIQAERNILSVYNGGGQRVVSFSEKSGRVIAYDKDDNYIGQIIKKEIKGKIEEVFVDALGKEHDSIPVELQTKEALTKANNQKRLKIYNDNNQVVFYGVYENGDLVLYDLNGSKKMKIKKDKDRLYIYDNQGKLIQSVLESEKERIQLMF